MVGVIADASSIWETSVWRNDGVRVNNTYCATSTRATCWSGMMNDANDNSRAVGVIWRLGETYRERTESY